MRKLTPKTIIKLTRYFYKEMYNLSLGEVIQISKEHFKKVPSLRDFHYRAVKLKQVLQSIHLW